MRIAARLVAIGTTAASARGAATADPLRDEEFMDSINARDVTSSPKQEPPHARRAPAASVPADAAAAERPTLICLSHLRWRFVYQRPQHLMSRCARHYDVLFIEEPVPIDATGARLDIERVADGIEIVVPRLPLDADPAATTATLRALVDGLVHARRIARPVLWYYTPMALAFTAHLDASLRVYDCMDELAAFDHAPPELVRRELDLLERADVVFTGGTSLYESKRTMHANVHAFPSSVDVAHFAKARAACETPADQRDIPSPRLGFFGVIDERFDTVLVDRVAAAHPDWHIVLVGPVVKIDPLALPRRPNIHYLGAKTYDELPRYLAGWDVALMPFAMNAATRFISPTKTPEYLAGGVPVVSTPVRDVVRHYGATGVVRIAANAQSFAAGVTAALEQARTARPTLLAEIDALLAKSSWDQTWDAMRATMRDAALARDARDQDDVEPAAPTILRIVRPRRARAYDFLIVGAGFAGSVLAERLARGSGLRVALIDRRPHIGGNAYDATDAAGVLVHRYGPHIFHTNAQRIVDYLSRFTRWRPYEHRVLSSVAGQLVPVPINLTTLNRVFGLSMEPDDAERFLAARAEPIADVRTSEDVVLSQVGRELYELFFRGYTRKQWGVDPSALDKSVAARIPTRTSTDDRYFTDTFQQMPLHGYTRLFENMLDHPNIEFLPSTSYDDARRTLRAERTIYSGPIDEFFGYRFGKLPYRSLGFVHKTLDRAQFQPVAVVNYPDERVRHTRITEYKHLTGQRHAKTSISYEYPSGQGDPYYPIPCAESEAIYRRYRALADATPNVDFVGRLGTYRYYNMDQVVGQALALYKRLRAATAVA